MSFTTFIYMFIRLNTIIASVKLTYPVMAIWLKSGLSFSPLYWYVATWEIWENPITDHMLMTLCTIQ
jgi:hypothetical protein